MVWITGHRRKNCSSDAGKMTLTRLTELRPGEFQAAAWVGPTVAGDVGAPGDSTDSIRTGLRRTMRRQKSGSGTPAPSHRLGLFLAPFFLAVVLVEQFLAEADRLWCHLDQLIVLDI